MSPSAPNHTKALRLYARIEEVVDLGGEVTLAVVHMHGRPGASTSHVSMHYASVTKWADGRIARVTNYLDLDQARAAAERLAGVG